MIFDFYFSLVAIFCWYSVFGNLTVVDRGTGQSISARVLESGCEFLSVAAQAGPLAHVVFRFGCVFRRWLWFFSSVTAFGGVWNTTVVGGGHRPVSRHMFFPSPVVFFVGGSDFHVRYSVFYFWATAVVGGVAQAGPSAYVVF